MNATIVAFFKVNSMKIKLSRIKVCKKKNLTCVSGIDRQICPSTSLVMPNCDPQGYNLKIEEKESMIA